MDDEEGEMVARREDIVRWRRCQEEMAVVDEVEAAVCIRQSVEEDD